MKIKVFIFLCLISIFLSTNNAYAAKKYCVGDITGVTVDAGGVVRAIINDNSSSDKFSNAGICKFNGTLGNYGIEACQGVLSLLQVAFTANKDVQLTFEDDTVVTNCDKNWGDMSGMGLERIRLQD